MLHRVSETPRECVDKNVNFYCKCLHFRNFLVVLHSDHNRHIHSQFSSFPHSHQNGLASRKSPGSCQSSNAITIISSPCQWHKAKRRGWKYSRWKYQKFRCIIFNSNFSTRKCSELPIDFWHNRLIGRCNWRFLRSTLRHTLVLVTELQMKLSKSPTISDIFFSKKSHTEQFPAAV